LSNILINLISNAIKFSPENSIIVIESVSVNESIAISVKDNGIGISDEDKKHLMERFYRGSNAINIQGTGLGMHIVSKYVERLNGKLEFESQLNCGTEFKIMLPNQKESVKNDSFIYENC
jgi:signal transduction histidine kinase